MLKKWWYKISVNRDPRFRRFGGQRIGEHGETVRGKEMGAGKTQGRKILKMQIF